MQLTEISLFLWSLTIIKLKIYCKYDTSGQFYGMSLPVGTGVHVVSNSFFFQFVLACEFKSDWLGFQPTHLDVGPDIMNLWTHLERHFAEVNHLKWSVMWYDCGAITQSADQPDRKNSQDFSIYTHTHTHSNEKFKIMIKKKTSCNDKRRLSHIGTVGLIRESIQYAPTVHWEMLPFRFPLPSTTLESNFAWVYWELADVWSAFQQCTYFASIIWCWLYTIHIYQALHTCIHNFCPWLPHYLSFKSCACNSPVT